jgi:hypothetical protein
LHDPQSSPTKINIAPTQGQYLSPPHSCRQTEQDRPVDVDMPDRIQQSNTLLNGQGRYFLSFDPHGLFECIGRIAREQLLFNCSAKSGFKDDVNVTSRAWGKRRSILPAEIDIGFLDLDWRKLHKLNFA